METNKKTNGLTDKEQKELELLENPQIEFTGSALSPIFSSFINRASGSIKKRKQRILELKMKELCESKELTISDKEYWDIKEREEKRIEELFKNYYKR